MHKKLQALTTTSFGCWGYIYPQPGHLRWVESWTTYEVS
jgi:hypothetical protein